MIIRTNELWDNLKKNPPQISVITPTYNREGTIERTIKSVFLQTYKDFEYIVVDDGSTDNTIDIVMKYMNLNQLPMMVIVKKNGGVHTARNAGISHCRGVLQTNIDSDDELLPKALEIFSTAWNDLPGDEKKQYREIVAQCMNADGVREGQPFPENINNVTKKEAEKMCKRTKGEHIGMNVTQIMKENPWPEAEGVTFIPESLLWKKLDVKYKSFFINDIVRIYHTDTEVSLTNAKTGRKTLQSCINARWQCFYYLNHKHDYEHLPCNYFVLITRYSLMDCIIKRLDINYRRLKLVNIIDNVMYLLLKLPMKIYANVYIKKRF